MPFPKNAHLRSPVVKPSCRADLLALLRKKPMTARELAPLVGRHPDTVCVVLRSLKGLAYIKEYRQDGTAIWAYGDQPYAEKPRAKKVKAPYRPTEHKQDQARLTRNYISGERIRWGDLCL